METVRKAYAGMHIHDDVYINTRRTVNRKLYTYNERIRINYIVYHTFGCIGITYARI